MRVTTRSTSPFIAVVPLVIMSRCAKTNHEVAGHAMSQLSEHRFRTPIILFTIAFLLVIVFAFLVLNPGTMVVEKSVGGGHVLVEIEPGRLIFPGGCTTMRWEAEGIQAIFFDGDPTTGQGSEYVCVNSKQRVPKLKVDFPNGERDDIGPIVDVLLLMPIGWGLIAGIVVLTFAAGYITINTLLAGRLTKALPAAQGVRQALKVTTFSVVVTFVIVEVALRVYFANFGTEIDRVRYIFSADEIDAFNDSRGGFIPMPYLNFGLSANREDHNQLGYRGEEIELPKPDGMFRIVALGGSTTYGSGIPAKDAYPAILQNILRDEYGFSNVEVINAGVPGYTTWESFVNFAFRVPELEPDMIIIYHAGNDVTLARTVNPGCYRGINPLRGLNTSNRIWSPRRASVSPSVLIRFLSINTGLSPDPTTLDSRLISFNTICREGERMTDDEEIAINRPIYFERNLRNIILLAEAHNIEVMLSSWAFDAEMDPVNLTPAWQTGVNEHNTIIEAIAAEMDLPFYDLAAQFEAHPEYWGENGDGIHFNVLGAAEQARQYADFIVAQELLPRP
ncbi:MAG: hypothetical protein D6737_06710 [Chloroflexi bacterium]|nr:MAG: hypothetical protein D6737_06710 [Chloroflexota bacterium]